MRAASNRADWCAWGGDVRQPWGGFPAWTASRDDDGVRRATCPGCGRRLVVRSNPMVAMYDMLPRHKTQGK